MIPDYKAKSPIEAYKKAWEIIEITWDETTIARHLSTAILVNYDNGAFTFEVPTQHIADLFNRHAEQSIVRRTLELYMPDGITVSASFVLAKAVQP